MTNDELFIIKLNIAPFFVVNVELQHRFVMKRKIINDIDTRPTYAVVSPHPHIAGDCHDP
jgi:hypothetical protein